MSDFSFIPPTSVATIPGTHASAAFDTLYIGCEKFPQHDLYPITLNGIKQLLHHSLNEKKQYLCEQEFKTNYRYEQAFNYAIFIAYCCDIKQLR